MTGNHVYDPVYVVVTSTQDQVFNGRTYRKGDQLPRHPEPLPRHVAEAMSRHASPGWRIDIEER
jgi:hypothetical protein